MRLTATTIALAASTLDITATALLAALGIDDDKGVIDQLTGAHV